MLERMCAIWLYYIWAIFIIALYLQLDRYILYWREYVQFSRSIYVQYFIIALHLQLDRYILYWREYMQCSRSIYVQYFIIALHLQLDRYILYWREYVQCIAIVYTCMCNIYHCSPHVLAPEPCGEYRTQQEITVERQKSNSAVIVFLR